MVKKRPRRSMARFYGALAVIALAGAALLAYVASRPKQQVTTVDPNLPPAKAEGYQLGDPNAPVQVLEFADFECPSCGQFAAVTEPDVRKRLIETGQVLYKFFDFPLSMHRNTVPASNAAACAADQGKFWEMHDRIFAGQDQWNTEATSNPKKIFKDYAREIGLDVDKWEQCFDAGTHLPRIEANRQEGERRMVNSTPTFVIGKRQMPGNLSYDDFKKWVDSAAVEAKASGASTAGTANAPTSGAAAGATPRR